MAAHHDGQTDVVLAGIEVGRTAGEVGRGTVFVVADGRYGNGAAQQHQRTEDKPAHLTSDDARRSELMPDVGE